MIVPRVVVSLSTLPPRGEFLAQTLDSLLNQSFRPQALFVNVPFEARRAGGAVEVPACLASYERRVPYLRVLRTADYGPGTKLLPALEQVQQPDAIIITVDDDMIYHRDLLATLVAASCEHEDWAVGFCGWNVARDGGFAKATRRFVDVLMGFSGAAYRRRFFTDSVFSAYRRHAACFYVDDVWISGYLAERGIGRFLLRPSDPGVRWPAKSPGTYVNALKFEPEKPQRNRSCALCWAFRTSRNPTPRLALPAIRTSYSASPGLRLQRRSGGRR